MKYAYLAKYTTQGLKNTLDQLLVRSDLSEAEMERRGAILIQELESRGEDPIQDAVDDW